MKMVRRIFDMLVALASTGLLGMLAYLALGGTNLPEKFVSLAELALVGLFLLTVVLNSPNFWRSVPLLIFGVLPLLALIASTVLPQYLNIQVPIVANVLFYAYLQYWHVYLAVTEKHRGEAPAAVAAPLQAGKPKTAKKPGAAVPKEAKE